MNILIEDAETLEFLASNGRWTKKPSEGTNFTETQTAYTAAKREPIRKFNIVRYFSGTKTICQHGSRDRQRQGDHSGLSDQLKNQNEGCGGVACVRARASSQRQSQAALLLSLQLRLQRGQHYVEKTGGFRGRGHRGIEIDERREGALCRDIVIWQDILDAARRAETGITILNVDLLGQNHSIAKFRQ